MITTEITIELVLSSLIDELKWLAIFKGFVFEHNVTVPALQGLLMPKALKRSHEEELLQSRMQLQAVEEEAAHLKAAHEKRIASKLLTKLLVQSKRRNSSEFKCFICSRKYFKRIILCVARYISYIVQDARSIAILLVKLIKIC